MNSPGHRKIFFGWWTNAVTATLTGLAQVFTGQGASALFEPISSEFGLSRAETSITSGISGLMSGVVLLIAGWLSDRFGAKRVIVSGSLLAGVGCVLLGFSPTLWSYFVFWGLAVAGVSLGFTVAIDTLLANWFASKRGLAFAVRFTVMGIISSLFLPVMSWLISTQGWRMTALTWGSMVFAGIPFSLYFVRQGRPEAYGLLPDGSKQPSGLEASRAVEPDEEAVLAIGEILRTRSYWMLTIVWVLYMIVLNGFGVHLIPFLIDMNISPIDAGNMLAVTSLLAIPFRVLVGIAADRMETRHLRFLSAGVLLLFASGILLQLAVKAFVGVYAFLILWAFGSSAFIPLDLVLRSHYFGREAFGQQQGISSLLSAPAAFFAPIYAGWIHDTTGNYVGPLSVFAVLIALSAFIMSLAQTSTRKKNPDIN